MEMRKMKWITLWMLIACTGSAQGTFVKVYDFPVVPVIGYNVQVYNERIYTIASLFCDLGGYFAECSFLAELTSTGDTLWMALIPDIDVASGTLVIVNDTITITGNNDPLNTAFLMTHFTLEGEKLGETIQIEHSTEKFTRMFQLTTQYFNKKFAICGRGIQNDTMRALIYIVTATGEIDTLIQLEKADQSRLWHSYIDSEGRLTTYHWVEYDTPPGPGPLPINYRKIYKFNTNYDTVWTYRSENTPYNDVIPYGCELQDGRTILSYTNPQQERNIHSIRAINPDGTKDWQHNYMVTGSRNRNIYRLKTLTNGDIMGSGSYTEKAGDPRISDSPWLFRMSPEGELLWERVYYDFDSTLASNGSSRIGTLYDFIELEDGSLLGVGDLWYDLKSSMLVIRVDSNGCLDPDDCQEIVYIDLLTNAEEPLSENNTLLLFPNPTDYILHITFETAGYEADILVMDMVGRLVYREKLINGKCSIISSQLTEGIYMVQVVQNGTLLRTGRFIKTGR